MKLDPSLAPLPKRFGTSRFLTILTPLFTMLPFIFVGMMWISGCGLLGKDANDVKDVTNQVLTDAQIACILSSQLTDDPTIAQICKIAKDLMPIIHDVVGHRESLKKAAREEGMREAMKASSCKPTSIPDAGVPDAR